MPIQFENLYIEAPGTDSSLYRVLSNPFYTAAAITFIFVVFLYIFSPLKNDLFRVYFKLFIYFGLLNSLILFAHDNYIMQIVEKKYTTEDVVVTKPVEVQPQFGGVDTDRELDELAQDLNKNMEEDISN